MLKLYLSTILVSGLFAAPQLNEPKILKSYEIPYKYKNINQEKFDILSLNHYLKALYLENKTQLQSKKRSDVLASDIRQDKYGFDVYVDGYLNTGRTITNYTTITPYSGKGAAFHVDKLLYDKDYFLSSKYKILYRRLADINKINSKNALVMAGVSTYSNLYFSRQALKIYKKTLETQKEILNNVKASVKKGKLSKIDLITAKTDLLNLQNLIVLETERYMKNDYILRQSINSRSQNPFITQPFNVNLNVKNIAELQKRVLNNNASIASTSDLLKIKKLDVISAEKRFVPEFRYYSYVGYDATANKEFSAKEDTKSTTWEVGLRVRVPLYTRNDITLKTEKAKYDVLLQKQALITKEKNTLIQASNLFNSAKSFNIQIKIAKDKLELYQEELAIYKERLLMGVIPYSRYSTVFNRYINMIKTLNTLQEKRVINMFLLKILIGDKIIE